jgi:uncharacterized membrane protein
MASRTTPGDAAAHGGLPLDKEWWLSRLRSLRGEPRAIQARASVTIRRTPRDLYAAFRDLEGLPQILTHLAEVRQLDGERWLMRVKVPGGLDLEWRMRLVEDVPDQRIAWRSLEGESMASSGEVRLREASGERGTELCVTLTYEPEALLARKAGKLLVGLQEVKLQNDLRALKQRLEIGEVMRSDASLARGPIPAQPREGAGTSELRGES